MTTVKSIQMQTFKGSDLSELQEKFNATMRWVSNHKYIEHVIDLPKREGYVVFEVTEKTPETLEDVLTLDGITLRCGQCEKFSPTYNKRGECEFCRGSLKNDDPVCPKFYTMWENGNCWLKKEEEEKYGDVKARLNTKTIAPSVRKKA